jgi:primosomal protein N'
VFAKIFPILKLPRRFGAFDYRIPDGSVFRVGDVIRIPFRRRQVFGVVSELLSVTQEPRVVETGSDPAIFTLSAEHLHHLTTVASELGQSPSSILSVALEGLQPFGAQFHAASKSPRFSFSIPHHTIETVRAILDAVPLNPSAAFSVDDETTAVLAHALCKSAKGQTLILVPRERDAQFFVKLLQPFTPMVLTGKTKTLDRNAIIRSWKAGEKNVLIGTRQTVLIEPNTLETILVVQAACEDHGSTMRNPHINAVRVAQALANHHRARFITTDPLPPLSIAHPLLPTVTKHSSPQIIDTTNRGESSAYPLLSQTLLEAIKTALHSEKKVLLSFNRKGVAKRLECKTCGHVPFCGTCGSLPVVRLEDLLCEACGTEMWKPTTCPACASPKIGPRLIGGTRIVDDLKKAFPTATVGHIEKGRIDLNAQIIVATEYFWSSVTAPFHKHHFGLVADLLADVGFAPGDYRGAEKTARKAQRLLHFAAHENAECIIQTVARDRLLSLLGATHVTEHERDIRKKYLLPPYSAIVSFEHAALEELPELFRPHTTNRHGILTAKIDHETFTRWQEHFPEIPDHINIRIQH